MHFLFQYSQELSTSLSNLDPTSFNEIRSVTLDCQFIPGRGSEGNCLNHPTTANFFEPLRDISAPALYWFQIVSDHNAKDLIKIIPGLKTKINRNVPAYKKSFCNWASRVLYVGKVKSNLSGRMVVHLGYYENSNTQGLQLCYWAQPLNLKLKLNYIVLPDSLKEVAGLFERKLANNLCPIFGKHR